MRTILSLATAVIFSAPAAAAAEIVVRFDESAPKDRFTITNVSNCALPLTSLTIDLAGSSAGLIFDVTRSGAGVNVFQPFQLVSGAEHLSALPQVNDGDRQISLQLKGLGPNQRIAFMIDVDDTAGTSETMVSGSEIKGNKVRVEKMSGTFGADSIARVKLTACTS